MNEKEYIKKLFDNYNIPKKAKVLFEEIIGSPVDNRKKIIDNLKKIKNISGLDFALLALYRQQVNCGFVLSDPLKEKDIKEFYDKTTGINFIITFNPDRELRKNHKLLIERGIIAKNIDSKKLINKKNGIGCYLCWKNILIQNPSEIIIKIKLEKEYYYIGANFAYITNNHFTIMNSKHIPQIYRKNILNSAISFLDKTGGNFRIIYNGRAGASIKEHEHLQATLEHFPLEEIKKGKVVFKIKDTKVYYPIYYTPLWIVESKKKDILIKLSDKIISEWERSNINNTVNLIFSKKDNIYLVYILLRDQRKLLSKGKTGAMASFEVGGRIVLSTKEEKIIFNTISLQIIKKFLKEISPEKKEIERLRNNLLKEFNRGKL